MRRPQMPFTHSTVFAWRLGAALMGIAAALGLAACGADSPTELMRSAQEYQARGDHRAAIIQLKNAVQKQPENGEARLLLGRSSLAVGDTASAEKEFRKALEFGQPKSIVLPLVAQSLLEGGQSDKVISEFAGVKLDDPKSDAELRVRVGEAQTRIAKLSDAATSFAAALAADPTNVRAQLGQVRLLAIDRKLDEALARADKVVADNPKSAEARVLQGELKLAAGDKAGARAALEQAIALAPVLPAARYELISLLLSDSQFDAAAEQVTAARAAHGDDLRLAYAEALIAVGRKDYAKARQLTQQVLKRAPDHVPTLVLAGAVDYQEKRYAEAEGSLQRAVSLAPQHGGARILLVRSYLATNQTARALDAIQPLVDSGITLDRGTMMLAGETYLANGDIRQASKFFDAVSKAEPQSSMARVRLGQIALLRGDLDAGIKELETATVEQGAPIQAEMSLVAAYIRKGDTAKALQAAQDIVKREPKNPTAHQILGSVHAVRNEIPAARAEYGKALELNPTFLAAAGGLARLDIAEGKPADARRRFEQIAEKDPKNELALLGLAEVMAGTGATTAEIAPVLQRAVQVKPDSVAARLALVNLYLRDKNTRAALTAAQEAAAGLGQDSRIQDALGRAQLAAGETNQAIETFNRLAAAEPNSPVPLMRLASVHISRKDLDKAIEALLRAQKVAPRDAAVAHDLVLAYVMQGKSDEALKQARALQTAAPKSAAGFVLEGDVHAASKQWTAAERAYREGLKVEAGAVQLAMKLHGVLAVQGKKAEADALARKWLVDYPRDVAFRGYMAEQALRAGDNKTAMALYQAVVAQQPNNVVALNNLAWVMDKLGDPKAMEPAERALKLAPDNPLVLDTMGVLLTSRGNAAKGVEYLARATALAPDRHDIRLNYAKALMKAGRADDARKELQQLKSVSQDFPGKAEIEPLLKQL